MTSFYGLKNKNNIFVLYLCIITIVLLLISALQASEKDARNAMLRAGGITEEDINLAKQKKTAGLFDLYILSIANTETLAIAGESTEQAYAAKSRAFGAFLPRLYLKGSKYLPQTDSKHSNPSGRSGLFLYARQPLFTGLDEWTGFKGSESQIKISEYNANLQANQLLIELSAAFFNIIQIEQDLKSNEEMLRLYEITLNELKRRASIGRSRQSEVQRTASEMYTLEADNNSLKNNLVRTRLHLDTLTGTSGLIIINDKRLTDPLLSAEYIASAVKKRWDVKAASEAVNFADIQLAAAYGGHLPSLYLDASYYLYQEKSSSGTKARDYSISAGAEIPIFTGGITAARIREAKSKKRQAGLRLSETIRLAGQDISDALQSWESAAEEESAFKKALFAAEEDYKLIQNEYRLNLVTILDVLTSLKSLQNARNKYQHACLQRCYNRIRLGVSTNEFSGESVKILKQ